MLEYMVTYLAVVFWKCTFRKCVDPVQRKGTPWKGGPELPYTSAAMPCPGLINHNKSSLLTVLLVRYLGPATRKLVIRLPSVAEQTLNLSEQTLNLRSS